MIIREILVTKPDGIGQRDCAAIVSRAMRYNSDITIEHETRKINAKSLIGVVSLGLKAGTKIVLIAKGDDEDDALRDLQNMFGQS